MSVLQCQSRREGNTNLGDLTAFFSRCSRVRVREAAASGLSGDDTAGMCSSSMRAAGSAGAELVGSCDISAMVVVVPIKNCHEE